jgi:hypothetical protein
MLLVLARATACLHSAHTLRLRKRAIINPCASYDVNHTQRTVFFRTHTANMSSATPLTPGLCAPARAKKHIVYGVRAAKVSLSTAVLPTVLARNTAAHSKQLAAVPALRACPYTKSFTQNVSIRICNSTNASRADSVYSQIHKQLREA